MSPRPSMAIETSRSWESPISVSATDISALFAAFRVKSVSSIAEIDSGVVFVGAAYSDVVVKLDKSNGQSNTDREGSHPVNILNLLGLGAETISFNLTDEREICKWGIFQLFKNGTSMQILDQDYKHMFLQA